MLPSYHPLQETKATIRLVVDADHSCKDSARPMAVPYVVSRPEWLVAARLPAAAEMEASRSTLLFFRGTRPSRTRTLALTLTLALNLAPTATP